MKSIILTALSLVSTSALAHPGHLSGESMHGFLHAEHLMLLAVVSVVIALVYAIRNR